MYVPVEPTNLTEPLRSRKNAVFSIFKIGIKIIFLIQRILFCVVDKLIILNWKHLKKIKNVTHNFKNLDTNVNSTQSFVRKKWNFRYNDNTNILGVISVSIVFGLMIGNMGRKAEIILHLFLVLNEISMRFVKIIMW